MSDVRSYTIYGKQNCPFCVKAKTLCGTLGIPFVYISVPEDISRDQLVDITAEYMHENQKLTVPQVFGSLADGTEQYIGGFDDMYAAAFDNSDTSEDEYDFSDMSL